MDRTRIIKACQGKSRSQGGLNTSDIKDMLETMGVSVDDCSRSKSKLLIRLCEIFDNGDESKQEFLSPELKPDYLIKDMENDSDNHCFEKLVQFQDDNPDLINMSGRKLVQDYITSHSSGSFRTRDQDQLVELSLLPVINKHIVVFRGQRRRIIKEFSRGISTSFLISTAKDFGEIIYVINVPAGSTVIPTYMLGDFECEITLLPGSQFETKYSTQINAVDGTEYTLIYVNYIEPEWLTEIKQSGIVDHDRMKKTFPPITPTDYHKYFK